MNMSSELTSALEKPYKVQQDRARDQYLAEVLDIVEGGGKPEGGDWLSTTEILANSKLSPSALRRRLKEEEQAGKLERWPGGGNGKMNYWRVKRNGTD